MHEIHCSIDTSFDRIFCEFKSKKKCKESVGIKKSRMGQIHVKSIDGGKGCALGKNINHFFKYCSLEPYLNLSFI